MRTLLFSLALLLGSLNFLFAQDTYLPVSTSSEAAKAEYFKARQAIETNNIPGYFDGLKAAVKIDPNFFMAYADLAFAETAFGQYDKAAAYIKPALAIDPAGFNEGERIHRNALQAWDKDPKADPSQYMEALTAAYPNTAEAHDLAGRSAMWLSNDPKAAVKHFQRVLELRPGYGGAYNSLGYGYMAIQEMDKAQAAFEKYLEVAPEEANAYDSMGEFYLNSGDYAKSAEYYDRAVALGMEGSKNGAEKARAAQIKSDIQAMENAWANALNARDIEALMALYTDDAVSMPHGAPTLRGKAAIRKNQEQDLSNMPAGMTYSFETVEVFGNADQVTETGISTYKDADGNVLGMGKYMCVWEKREGKYLCAREIYNNDQPPAPAGSLSVHLLDLPADVTEQEILAMLTEVNAVIAEQGYPGAGYYFYKTDNAATKDYTYYFEGVWPSEEVYAKIHQNPAFLAATKKYDPLYNKIKDLEIYRRVNRVK